MSYTPILGEDLVVSVITTQKVTMMRRDWAGGVQQSLTKEVRRQQAASTKVAPLTVVAKAAQAAVAQVAATGGISTAHWATVGSWSWQQQLQSVKDSRW